MRHKRQEEAQGGYWLTDTCTGPAVPLISPDSAEQCCSVPPVQSWHRLAQILQRQKQGSVPAPALCTVHTTAPHQHYTPGSHCFASFTPASHSAHICKLFTTHSKPTFHLAFHLAPAHSTPTLRHLTPDLECCAAIVTCFDHGSLIVFEDC